jgi:hypothetical protein
MINCIVCEKEIPGNMCAGHLTIKGELKSYHLSCELPMKKYLSIAIDGSNPCIQSLSDGGELIKVALDEAQFDSMDIKTIEMTVFEFENLEEFGGF